MSRRAWWITAALTVIAFYIAAVAYWWNSLPQPYEQPRKQTPCETEQVRKALKRHGRITLITTPERIYFVRDNKEITILWRGYADSTTIR